LSEYSCLFLVWPSSLLHHSPLWCSDPPRFKEHHLDLEVCIFIASLHVWLVFFVFVFYSDLYNGPERLQYRGTRQCIMKHVSRIRPIAPLGFWNRLRQRTILQQVIGSPSFPSLDGHMGKRFHFICDFFKKNILSLICKQQFRLNFSQTPPSEASK
jgi:hypothetical protein